MFIVKIYACNVSTSQTEMKQDDKRHKIHFLSFHFRWHSAIFFSVCRTSIFILLQDAPIYITLQHKIHRDESHNFTRSFQH